MKTLFKIIIDIVLFSIWLPGISQTQISGTINRYAKVTSINSADNVNVDNAAGFSEGDTVMVIQMKSVEIEPTSNSILDIHDAGRYEFIAIQQITGLQVKFRSNLINSYNALQALQLVKVPYYQNAKVTGKLYCDPWDGNKGGVLALMVSNTLELNDHIDASAKGFLGGEQTFGSPTCYLFPAQINYTAAATDSAGLKGESIVESAYPFKRGRGPISNGGGGGNGFGAGGGGGSGYANGGSGGNASVLQCGTDQELGGDGGEAPKDYFAGVTMEQRDRIFMGGGGGASRGQLIGESTKGGSGGGIVFIIAQHLKTNNIYTIRSNGENIATGATNEAGAGGGGGGGSIMLAVDKLSGTLRIEAKGGNGGNTGNYCSGQGGGGGGGFFWFSGKTMPMGSLLLNGGSPGGASTSPCTSSVAFSGGDGDSANYLNPVLNGFLFNLITDDQSICFGDTARKLTGSLPRGGNGMYIYQWQYRSKSTSYAWKNLAGANQKDYSTGNLYDTTDFRRIVKSIQVATTDSLIDTSKLVKITVAPEIKQITIAPLDTAICYNQERIKIRGAEAYGGNVNYSLDYLWEESLDNNSWKAAPAPNNTRDYANTANDSTKFYRRRITNHLCTVVSGASHIVVHPPIASNAIQQAQVVCNGATPVQLLGSSPTGGANVFRFQWLKKYQDSLYWTPTHINDTLSNYSPGPLSKSVSYRRVVYSGLNNTCKDSSSTILITVLPVIGNNIIQQDQTICEGTSPGRFTGSAPVGGDGTYRYEWGSSSDNTTWEAIASIDSVNFTHGAVLSEKYFRRIVFSGDNNCCKDTTATTIKITVQPRIRNNIVGDTSEICYGQTPPGIVHKGDPLLGGIGNYSILWQQKAIIGAWIDLPLADQLSYQPGPLTQTTFFRRKVTSGTCLSLSDSIQIQVLDAITGNTKPAGTLEVCKNAGPAAFKGPVVSGGKPGNYNYSWEYSTDGSAWDSIADAHAPDYQSLPLAQNTYFRRIVKSGFNNCCISIGDAFVLNVSEPPSGIEAGNPQKFYFRFAAQLHAQPPVIGSGTWATSSPGVIIANPNDTATEVSNLPFGKNTFYWTVANGSCPALTDSVSIEVDDLKKYTGFSPNNDNINEYFIIDGLEYSTLKKLTVFNRWGSLVFSSENYDNLWNGTNKNGEPLPDDTYFYILETDWSRVYKGYIVIKR